MTVIGATYRTHTRVQQEDADDGCTSTVRVTELHPWMCPRCGDPNDKHAYLCHFCSWERSDHGWKCPDCDHLNKTWEGECELCGRRKPEGL